MKVFIIDRKFNFKEKEMFKADFVKLFSLNIRDLRPVYSSVQVATILQRSDILIINLGFIKAILSKDEIYFLEQSKNNELTNFLNLLKGQDYQKVNNFYLWMIEKILDQKARQMRDKVANVNEKVNKVLPKIRKSLADKNLTELLLLKKRVSKLETRLGEIREAVKEILDDQEEFNDLVAVSSINMGYEDADEETESILENFIEQIEDFIGNIYNAKEEVQDTEEYINLRLSSRRTNIVKFDLIATIFTLNLSFLAVVVGFFGVNLKNHLENSDIMFWGLGVILILLFIIITFGIFVYLKKKKVF